MFQHAYIALSGLLNEGHKILPADMPGADELMMRIYAAQHAMRQRQGT